MDAGGSSGAVVAVAVGSPGPPGAAGDLDHQLGHALRGAEVGAIKAVVRIQDADQGDAGVVQLAVRFVEAGRLVGLARKGAHNLDAGGVLLHRRGDRAERVVDAQEHRLGDPAEAKVVPRSRWFAPPAKKE